MTDDHIVAFSYTCSCRIHTDTMIKTDAGRLLYKYMYLPLYCKGSKRLFKVCVWEGAEDRTETEIFWPLLLWPVTLCLSRSPDAQPEALGSTLLGAGFLYCFLSASSLDPNSSEPQGPFGLRWLSLPHLVYNSSPALIATATGTRTQLSYIIVQRPLDLWNRMFNRHQAEITVMQFRGHTLPVRQYMRVSWDFLACPVLFVNFRPRDFLS